MKLYSLIWYLGGERDAEEKMEYKSLENLINEKYSLTNEELLKISIGDI